MPLIRVFFYLLWLRDQGFYGDVKITLHPGKETQVWANQGFKESTLPSPPAELRAAYGKEIADGLRGLLLGA